MKISIVISALNAESKIEKVLKSVSWADEVILIDNESTDDTVGIARKHNAKVYIQKNNSMLNTNKNYGFQKASHEWILNLDSDEVVTEDLTNEIKSIITNDNSCDGYWISRKNIIFGKWIKHGIWWPDKQLRLFKKGKGKFPCVHIHEYIEVDGKTCELNNPFIHYNYETISQYIRKLNSIYTENEVNILHKNGKKFVWQDLLKYPFGDFLKLYFKEEGYKDGIHGLVLAILQMFYTFVVYAKLWERSGFEEKNVHFKDFLEETRQRQKDFKYWQNTIQIETEKNILYKIYLKIKRKYL